MKEEKEKNKIVEEEAVVVNEKDIINPEEVKEGETIEVEAPEVIIEKAETEEVKEEPEGEDKQEPEGEDKQEPEKAANKEEELVAKLSVYYDKVLKIDIKQGAVIKDIYEENGVKLTKKRSEELVKAGVAELK